MLTTVAGPPLAVQTCARRLAPHGVQAVDTSDPARLVLGWSAGAGATAGVDCEISWWGPGRADEPGGEALVQAATGLMHLHGRDLGGPRRIGLEVCTVAAGMLAAQALLAAAVGRCRGVEVAGVRTSAVQAGLLQASHYLAAATCPPEELPAPGPEPGPPFRTADDRWFEIETFDTEAWKAFWLRLDAPAEALGRAWTAFRPRYYRGTTSLPGGFHDATARRTLAEIGAIARDSGVSLSPVRGYGEVLGEAPAQAFPLVARLDGGPGGRACDQSPRPGALPLAGLRVVEATSRLQGPLAGLLLQMLGAHVTRVEAPGGDVGRSVPPLAGDTGSFFLCFNRGKETVELDLATPAGRAELGERAAAADVFLHNWRPGKAAEWGLDAGDLAAASPRLVYVEASGWAPGSPAAGLIGTDFLVQAWTGLANALDPDPDPPRPSRVLLSDFMGALVTCEGVLAGLYRRELGGAGSRVSTSLEAGAMALQAHVLDGLGRPSTAPGRTAGGRPVWGPLDVPIRAGDGMLVVDAAGEARRRLAAHCGVGGGDGDGGDGDGGDGFGQAVAHRIGEGTVADWVERLRPLGLGCQPVVTELGALPDDPQMAPLFEPLGGGCRAPASPWRLET